MNRLIHLTWFTAPAALALSLKQPEVLASSTARYELSWSSLDGGGATHSSGGRYELGGTIGQPDAGLLAGGRYGLTGGFWTGGTSFAVPLSLSWGTSGLILCALLLTKLIGRRRVRRG
jgi:hypothetical protein